eukprot:scaffold2085_cov263-Pinguiococcus_pyrenoidosus.AAC.9
MQRCFDEPSMMLNLGVAYSFGIFAFIVSNQYSQFAPPSDPYYVGCVAWAHACAFGMDAQERGSDSCTL